MRKLTDVKAAIVAAKRHTAEAPIMRIVMEHGGIAGGAPSLKALPAENYQAVIEAVGKLSPTTPPTDAGESDELDREILEEAQLTHDLLQNAVDFELENARTGQFECEHGYVDLAALITARDYFAAKIELFTPLHDGPALNCPGVQKAN